MSKHPNFEKIELELKKGIPFQLSREQYISLTGTDLPQNKSYTCRNSAIAKKAKEYGYNITVIPEVLIFQKEK